MDWRISLGRFQPPTNWTVEVTKMSGIYPHFTKVGAELDAWLLEPLEIDSQLDPLASCCLCDMLKACAACHV